MDFTGKTAIVTGGAQGIGLAVVRKLAGFGARVAIADINAVKAAQAENELRAEGRDVMAVRADTADTASLRGLCDTVVSRWGGVDLLVNNAGVSRQVPLAELDENEYDKFMAVNLKGMIFLCKYIMPVMRERGGGRIVNMASLSGQRGGRFAGIHYTASKGGVLSATKALALMGGEMGINVNAVAPGLIDTEMGAGLNFTTSEIVLGRLGTADEVADGVVFLLSDMARYITGFTLDVNGGMYMH